MKPFSTIHSTLIALPVGAGMADATWNHLSIIRSTETYSREEIHTRQVENVIG